MSKFNVGDVVRVSGEDFDSVVMQVQDDYAILAGWPNPRLPLVDMTLVRAYDASTADAMQRACVEREQKRLASEAKAAAERCSHCNGTGRRPTSAVTVG